MTTSKFKISNKVLSMLLCMVLLLSYVPLINLTAFAADGYIASVTDKDGNPVGSYTTFADAVTAAADSEGSTLKLLDTVPITTEQEISSGKFTLDLNGKTLLNASDNVLYISGNDVQLTIKDSGEGGTVKTTAPDYYAVYNNGTLTVESGTVTGASGISNAGTLTFNGGTAEGSSHDAIINTSTGKAYISGGSFTSNGYAALNLLGGTVEITGGSFTGKSSSGSTTEWTVS